MDSDTLKRLVYKSNIGLAWELADQDTVLCELRRLRVENDRLKQSVDELAEANWREFPEAAAA